MPPILSISLWEVSGTAWVRLEGELDLFASRDHRQALLWLARTRPLVIDARALSFVDLAGTRLVDEVAQTAERRGHDVVVVMSHALRRVATLDHRSALLARERDADTLLADPAGPVDAMPRRAGVGAVPVRDLAVRVQEQLHRSRLTSRRSNELAERGRGAATRARLTVSHVTGCRARRALGR